MVRKMKTEGLDGVSHQGVRVKLEKLGRRGPRRHCQSSEASVLFGHSHLDIIRLTLQS
jgi:hypothetical protein